MQIRSNEAALFLGSRIDRRVDTMRNGVVIIVAPFVLFDCQLYAPFYLSLSEISYEMIGKLISR